MIHTVKWLTTQKIYLLGIDNSDVHVRLIPNDADPGFYATLTDIHIDYNEPPSIELEDIFRFRFANVTINYRTSQM